MSEMAPGCPGRITRIGVLWRVGFQSMCPVVFADAESRDRELQKICDERPSWKSSKTLGIRTLC
jgi:hypothetical protein